jgi:hypothetical protein
MISIPLALRIEAKLVDVHDGKQLATLLANGLPAIFTV